MSHLIIIIWRNCQVFYNISFVDFYIGKIEFFFSNLVLGTPCKIFIIKWMFSCHLQCKRSVKFFRAESFNQTRKRRHSEFYCYKKLFVWKRVVNKSSLWRLKNEQQSVWTGTYISLLFNRFKMFHMKWVKEGKKILILILYRYVHDEVMKFEDIGEPNLPSKIVISSQRKK